MAHLLLFLLASLTACDVPDHPAPGQEATARRKHKRSRRRAKTPRKKPHSEAGAGRWREFRTHRFDGDLSDAQRQEIDALEAIGYLSGSALPDGGDEGVVLHLPATAPGVNLVTSGHHPGAMLIDADGKELHRWELAFDAVWPDYPVPEHEHVWNTEYWRRAHLLPDGSLLAIFEGYGLIKVARDNTLVWSSTVRAHHDLDVTPSGDIWVLTREAHVIPRVHRRKPVLEDFVSLLGPDGVEKKRISLLKAFERSPFAAIWAAHPFNSSDLFHTNSLSLLDGKIGSQLPAFASGNLLLSMLKLNTVAVLDPSTQTIVWAQQGPYITQHDPTLLSDGQLLVFDNNGGGSKRSRVLEFDPVSHAVSWQYPAEQPTQFWSKTCGTAQRLPNGNTLITESDAGRAREVTAQGEVVWAYHNPHRAGAEGQFVATLFEVERMAAPAWLGSP